MSAFVRPNIGPVGCHLVVVGCGVVVGWARVNWFHSNELAPIQVEYEQTSAADGIGFEKMKTNPSLAGKNLFGRMWVLAFKPAAISLFS